MNLETRGRGSVYLSSDKKQVVDAVAYTIAQYRFAQHVPEAASLEWGEFRDLLVTVKRSAQLNARAKQGRAAATEYTALMPAVKALVEKAPQWRSLLGVAAQIAHNANDRAAEAGYSERELALLPSDSADRPPLADRVTKLNEELAAIAMGPVVPSAAGPTTQPTTRPTTTVAAGSSTPLQPDESAAKRLRRMVGTSDLAMTHAPVIAVVGGLPDANLIPDAKVEFVGVKSASAVSTPDDFMPEYNATLVQAARLVAPDARFLFAPAPGFGGTSTTALLPSVRALVDQRPDVLLVALKGVDDDQWQSLFAEAADHGTVVVLSAGNEYPKPLPFAGKQLIERLMVVAAVSATGKAADFTQRGPRCFWAPGTDIPVVVAGGRRETRDGTAYSAAIAAGVVARVRDRRGDRDVTRLLESLAKSARPVSVGGPRVLSFDDAVK